jgi:hypothetical protein
MYRTLNIAAITNPLEAFITMLVEDRQRHVLCPALWPAAPPTDGGAQRKRRLRLRKRPGIVKISRLSPAAPCGLSLKSYPIKGKC